MYAKAAPNPNMMPYVRQRISMFSVQNDEISIPPADRSPPMKVVVRSPILSTRIPETGDNRNVVPIARDPTRAEIKRNEIRA